MNERERWIVYPLLFLALGVALRDKLVDRTTTKSIVCEELSIVDSSSGQALIKLGRAEAHPGVPPTGVVMVEGVLETRDFVWQRMPVLPIQVSPGAAVLGVLQAVAQPGGKLPNLSVPKPHSPAPPKPSASGTQPKQTPVPPPSPAGEDSSEK